MGRVNIWKVLSNGLLKDKCGKVCEKRLMEGLFEKTRAGLAIGRFTSPRWSGDFVDIGNYFANKSVFHRFLSCHPAISCSVISYALDALTRSFCNNAVDPLSGFQNFLGVNLNISCITAETSRGLMDQESGIG